MNPKGTIANLKHWQPGQSGNPKGNPRPGPKIAPAMHKYADMPYEELMALAADEKRAEKLPMSHVIAITALLKAADVEWGDRSREFVTDRLDGPNKVEINDNRVQVLVREIVGIDPKQLG